jgi:predicted glycoside hydrolase/deacetylase ChbG (UPF0249 family)
MKLIFNADDLAISEKMNNTILMLHKQGIVTSATIIAAGKYFNHAVEISRDNPALGIGVHLCLDGPFNIGDGYSTIMSRNTNTFFTNHQLKEKFSRFSVNESEIYREYCLQIEKVLDHQIKISHLDSHHHSHLYVQSLKSMIKAARKFEIHYIRSQVGLLRQNQSFINHAYRYCHQLFLKSKIKTVDGIYEPSCDDYSDYEKEYYRFLKLLTTNKSTVEVMLHPRDKDDPETLFFTSDKVKDLLSNHNLINYNDLK